MEEVIQKYENSPLDSQTITPNPDQDLTNKLAFEKHLNDKTNGYILRSKVQTYKQNEKSSKYFLNIEKSACQNTV